MRKDKKLYRILVVEDNSGDFLLIQDYLEENMINSALTRASTFKEASEYLSSSKNAFDVILLDLSLPDSGGETLIKNILTLSLSTPVIALTGLSDVEFSIRSMSMGIYDYLLKDDLNGITLYKSIVYNIEKARHISQLVASEKRYSDLFHLSPQPMWVIDLGSLDFLDVNNAALNHYGYHRDEFLTMNLRHLLPDENNEEFEAAVAANQNRNLPVKGIFRHTTKNKELIYVELQSNLIMFKDIEAKIVMVNDVTELQQYVGAIEKQNEKLREIAWIQSHIVRAPLARLMGLADLMRNYEMEAAEQKELLQHLLTSANEVDQIIREIVGKASRVDIIPVEKGSSSRADKKDENLK